MISPLGCKVRVGWEVVLSDGKFFVEVLSYNLLAPAFVRPIDLRTGEIQPFAAFQWVSEEGPCFGWMGRCFGSVGLFWWVVWDVEMMFGTSCKCMGVLRDFCER